MNAEKPMQPEINAGASTEIIDIANARFMDTLAPEQEELWENIRLTALEFRENPAQAMLPIWADESIPQVFRDRAMVITLEEKGRIGFNEDTFDAYAFNDPQMRNRFSPWLKDLVTYRKETGRTPIPDGYTLRWAIWLHGNGYIQMDEFEHILASIDLEEAAPKTKQRERDGSIIELGADRFLLLSDLLDARDDGTPKYGRQNRRWAMNQLDRWITAQGNENNVLPTWLANATPDQAYELIRQVCRQQLPVRGEPKETFLGWDTLDFAIQYAGWERVGFTLYDASRLRDDILRFDLVYHLVTSRKAKREQGNDVPVLELSSLLFVKDVIEHSGRREFLADLKQEERLTVALCAKEKGCSPEDWKTRYYPPSLRRQEQQRREVWLNHVHRLLGKAGIHASE